MKKTIKILWKHPMSGIAELSNSGRLIQPADGKFSTSDGVLLICVENPALEFGSCATILTLRTNQPFTFFLRDVNISSPIYIPEYEVVVTTDNDTRTYDDIVSAIMAKGRKNKISKMEQEPEETFDAAAQHNRCNPCHIWLGISRDIRIFETRIHSISDLNESWDTIQPMLHHSGMKRTETKDDPLEFNYFAGRGLSCRLDVERSLERGVLPIYNVKNLDGDILYTQKMFVTNEITPLVQENIHGTNYLIADQYAFAHSKYFPPADPEAIKKLRDDTAELRKAEIHQEDQPVMYLRITGENQDYAPKYAFFRIPQPNVCVMPSASKFTPGLKNGIGYFTDSNLVYMIGTINGMPVQDVEYAILLQPGEKVTFEFKLPHSPISQDRAVALARQNFDDRLSECIAFWEKKLDTAAQVHLPEKRIDEMMRAGLLHLDLVCFGNEPDGPVAPVVGIYPPIGTESTPIIQYLESMGKTDVARRAIEYFLAEQHEDGFIQTIGTYMSETGPVLWNAARHYQLTKDRKWLSSVSEHLVRGCRYIRNWAEQSKDESIRHKGYGLVFGKVADVEYTYHSYMLNAGMYAGVRSCADVLGEIGDPNAVWIETFAQEYLQNFLDSLKESFATAPLVPLSDGTWCPSMSMWPETMGMNFLFAQGGHAYSHAMMVDCNQNGSYEMFYGIIDPESIYGTFTIKALTELMTLENTAFSQPYYCVHPYAHLVRREVRSFIKEFYNNMSALADRETYTFWEHFHHASPHKTHEEGWFLMRCCWMLFLDRTPELRLLAGIPRRWMEDGKTISFENMVCRYGKLSVKAVSSIKNRIITASVRLCSNGTPLPDVVTIRLPHPDGIIAMTAEGGVYDPTTETVSITNFTDTAEIVLHF